MWRGGTSNLQGGAIFAQGTVTIVISNTEFKSNTASDAVSEISSLFGEKDTSWHFCMCGGGNFNLQGGAIYAGSGVDLKISSTTFERNQAGNVSAIFEAD